MPAVVGDVHGQHHALEELLARLALEPKELIFLGDYVDRGPDSRQVLERVRQLHAQGAVALLGNHEEMMLNALKRQPDAMELWLRNGGVPTLYSFAGQRPPATGVSRRLVRSLLEKIPAWVPDFLTSLPLYHVWQEYVMVHAGVRPGRTLEQQRRSDLLWIRDEFLQHDDPLPGKTVIFGHTVTYFLTHRLEPIRTPGKIGIDTGAGYGGCLTAFMIPEETYEQVPVAGEPPQERGVLK